MGCGSLDWMNDCVLTDTHCHLNDSKAFPDPAEVVGERAAVEVEEVPALHPALGRIGGVIGGEAGEVVVGGNRQVLAGVR